MIKLIVIQFSPTGQLFSLLMLLLSAQAVKSREVYTTLYTSDTAPLASFYTPNAAYTRHNFFGPNETPLAVITGYDSYSMTLELDDLSNGAILLSKDIYTRIGRTSYQPLLIAKSGEYKVRVLLGNSALVLQACTRQEYVVSGGRAVAGAALEL